MSLALFLALVLASAPLGSPQGSGPAVVEAACQPTATPCDPTTTYTTYTHTLYIDGRAHTEIVEVSCGEVVDRREEWYWWKGPNPRPRERTTTRR